MRMLMPSHVKNVKGYEDALPIFTHYKSKPARCDVQPRRAAALGGYIVLNQAEALVSIDVNSGRATREHPSKTPL